MPKLTLPMFSKTASGKLAAGLKFTTDGTTTIARRPNSTGLPPIHALRGNIEAMRQAQILMTITDIHTDPFWTQYAELNKITRRNAYLTFAIRQFNRMLGFPWNEPDIDTKTDPGPVMIELVPDRPEDRPAIEITWEADVFWITIHALTPADTTPKPANTITMFNNFDIIPPYDIPTNLTRPFTLVATSWACETSVHQYSDPLIFDPL